MKRVLLFSVALLAGVVALSLASGSQEAKPSPKADTMMKSDDTMKKSDSTMMVADSDKTIAADPSDSSVYNVHGLGPQVVAFTSEAVAQNLAKTQTVVYFFAATWRPDCQATYKDIKANFGQIPSNKYGITAQYTFVVVGSTGEKKKVFNGTTTVAELVKNATSI